MDIVSQDQVASVLVFGDASRHIEIRVRIIIKLAIHDDLYTNFRCFSRGLEISEANSKKLPVSYAMYSDVYIPGDILTSNVIKRIYDQEIVNICIVNEFMGIWQLFGLASVLERPLLSVYPNLGNTNVQKDLNRLILPRNEETSSKPKMNIMWSSTRTDMAFHHWVPNHFVPLLPLTTRNRQEIVVAGYRSGHKSNH